MISDPVFLDVFLATGRAAHSVNRKANQLPSHLSTAEQELHAVFPVLPNFEVEAMMTARATYIENQTDGEQISETLARKIEPLQEPASVEVIHLA